MSETCHSCKRPLGVTRYIVEGFLGTYHECEWCFAGTDRPPEPELITDSFTDPPAMRSDPLQPTSLDRIIDKLTGTSGDHADRAYADERERLESL